ncbi:phage protein Gp27 family protein [Pseudomonas huaxiensis]|uniref:phage protein Gp27 family protein n=1 Tax=Pseudomonas huaxiensis TaxID=2213017 RepID=UPI000DA6C667|nr:phage protein Gp27 family protein [Pseudomonas huaxiensis]
MPRVKKIMLLPTGLREQLNTRLRKTDYSGLVELANWLSQQGHKVGKSAVHRYSVELKARDQAAEIAAQYWRREISHLTTSDMLTELGMLRIREHQIIEQLLAIGQDASPQNVQQSHRRLQIAGARVE